MSFFPFIEKLRGRPQRERRVMSLVGTSAIFLLIVTVWLTTFQLKSERVENEEAYNELSPVASLKDMSTRFIQDIKKQLNTIGDISVTALDSAETDTAATYTASTHEISNKDIAGTTTEDDLLNNGEENEVLFGTLSDIIKSATSSDDINNTDEIVEFIEDTAGDEEKSPPTDGEEPN